MPQVRDRRLSNGKHLFYPAQSTERGNCGNQKNAKHGSRCFGQQCRSGKVKQKRWCQTGGGKQQIRQKRDQPGLFHHFCQHGEKHTFLNNRIQPDEQKCLLG